MAKVSSLLAIVVIVAIIISSFVLAIYLRVDLPTTTPNVEIPTLENQVSVVQDQFGIYHIKADSTKAGLMAEGYLMARERLWQMDIYRREAKGELAQIFYQYEPSTLQLDYSLRALGLFRIAQRDWKNFSNDTQSFYQAFTDGVNLFIKNNENRLPVEFGILNYVPALWNPVDSIAIIKLMAFGLNANAGGEPIIGRALSVMNASKLLNLVKLTLNNDNVKWSDPIAYPVVKAESSTESTNNTNTNTTSTNTTTTTSTNSTTITTNTTTLTNSTSFSNTNQIDPIDSTSPSSLLDYLSSEFDFTSNIGSNNWVVAGSKTATGKPMLANDPHLPLESPSRWFFIDLQTPDFHVTGSTLPGIPGVVIGRNDHIMWGMTNSEIDYLDTYVEKFNDNYTQYYYNGTWRNTTILHEKFYISQNQYIPRDVYITTGNGTFSDGTTPVGNDTFSHGARPVVTMFGQNTTVRWTGQDSTNAAIALIKMDESKTREQFLQAVSLYDSPGQNIVYADDVGNIGLVVNGNIPIRNAGYGLAPHNGSLTTYEWKSYVPQGEIWDYRNPRSGFIATANNRVIPSYYPYFLGWAFDSNYRIDRIDQLLSPVSNITYNYMQKVQTDVHSLFAQAVVPKILIPTNDTFILSMEQSLANWDFNYGINSTQGPILALFTKYFLNFTLADDITPTILNELPITGKLTENLLDLPQNDFWFNLSYTKTNETKNDIILMAFNAVKNYYISHNLDINTYTWGDMHKVQLVHLLGSRFDFFNAGGLQPSPGDKYTINVGTYNSNFIQTEGPSMRVIMGLDNAKTFYMIIPGGESGLVGSNHYADMVTKWLEGNYCLITIEE